MSAQLRWEDEMKIKKATALRDVRRGVSYGRGVLVAAGQIVYFAVCDCARAHDGLCDSRRIMRRVEGPDGQDHGTRRLPDPRCR